MGVRRLNEQIVNFHLNDEYFSKNPSLDVQDTCWKVDKIIPLVDALFSDFCKKEVNLLDIGGGTGLICNRIATYIRNNYDKKVNKFLLDLSPGILEVQKKNNPDFKQALNEDIRKTTFNDKQIDLALIIDVLEHIPDPEVALKEIKRISKHVVLKVPLEDNLYTNIRNVLTRGRQRKDMYVRFGHVNFYNFKKLRSHIEKYCGRIVKFNFANTFSYFNNSDFYRAKMSKHDRFVNVMGEFTFRFSQYTSALIFSDFVMILAGCYEFP